MRTIDKIECTEAECKEYLAQLGQPYYFDGMRWTVRVKMAGGIWNKPVAAKIDGKYYKLVDK